MNPNRREFLESAFGLSVIAAGVMPQPFFRKIAEPLPKQEPYPLEPAAPPLWAHMTLFSPVGFLKLFPNAFEYPVPDPMLPGFANHFREFCHEAKRKELISCISLVMKFLKRDLFPHLGQKTQLTIEHSPLLAEPGDYIVWLPARPDLLGAVGEHQHSIGAGEEFDNGFDAYGPISGEPPYEIATFHTEPVHYYPIHDHVLGFANDRVILIRERKPDGPANKA